MHASCSNKICTGRKICEFISLAAFTILALGCWVSAWNNFLPSKEAIYYGNLLAGIIAMICLCFLRISAGKDNLLCLAVAVFPYFISSISLCYGLTWMAHQFKNVDDQIEVTVIAKNYDSRSEGEIKFREFDYLGKFPNFYCKQISGVQRSVFDSIKRFDRLILTGTRSSFGFDVLQISQKDNSITLASFSWWRPIYTFVLLLAGITLFLVAVVFKTR